MNTICKMRDIYKALSISETAFEEVYGISLNKLIAMCIFAKPERKLPRLL